MGRDKVLGLSLAILVIGIAAAFCFRNEPFVENGLKLARANILDDAISKLPGPKPYPQETKHAKPKATLPTVTLNGIESVDPFVERQASATADREKSATPTFKPKQSVPVKLAAADNRSIPMSMPVIDTRAETDGPTASIDTDKATPEITTSKPSTAPAFPAEKPSSEASTLLTSTAPPVTEPSVADKEPTVGEIVIRPNPPSKNRPASVKEHNVAWQSKAAEEHRDAIPENSSASNSLADNSPAEKSSAEKSSAEDSPRIEPKSVEPNGESKSVEPKGDDSIGDDPHRNDCTRENPTRNIPGVASANEANADEKPIQDTPVAIDSPPGDRMTTSTQGEPSTPQTDASAKAILHRVRRGDMLTKIALHYLGDSRRYREIFEANRDQLRTPNDRLKIGMMLRIPANGPQPVRTEKAVANRKSHSKRGSRSTIGTTGASKVPVHNAARLREKPPSEPIEKPSSATTDDPDMRGDDATTNRFVPVRRAPFLPGEKGPADQSSLIIKPETKAPATSYRSVPRRAAITLAGDREDATIR
jgi:nucleoid-associated protein YgaU